MLDALGVVETDFHRPAEADCRYTHPGYTAGIFADRQLMGLVGRIDAAVLQNFDLKQDVYIFELNLSALAARVPAARHFQPIARFPSVARDLTVIIDKKIEAGALVKQIRQMKEDLVESILLFAVYDKKPIPEGRKSISIRITYRSSAETLEDDAVNIIHRSISERIITKFDATLPA